MGINTRFILTDDRPAITALIYGGNIKKVKDETAKVIEQEANIVGPMLEGYASECRTEKGLKELINEA